MAKARLFLVVCEGSSDFALIEGIIEDAGQRLGIPFRAELIAPPADATLHQYERFGWSQVKSWCRGNARRIGSILALMPADGLFIHMDTDVAEQIEQDGEIYNHATHGISRHRWCECAMQQWLGTASSLPSLNLLLPTYQIESWLLATFDDKNLPPGFILPAMDDFQSVADVEPWLLQKGFKEDQFKPGRIYKEKTLYHDKYLPLLLTNRERVRRRCSEYDSFQQILGGYAI